MFAFADGVVLEFLRGLVLKLKLVGFSKQLPGGFLLAWQLELYSLGIFSGTGLKGSENYKAQNLYIGCNWNVSVQESIFKG